jgi:hypothetical protein
LPDYDGAWNGTTSQGKPISFVVESNAVTSFSLQAEAQGNGCTTKVESTLGMNVPIVDGAFEHSTKVGDATHTIQANFSSGTSASGTLYYAGTVGCSGEVEVQWTAERGAAAPAAAPGSPRAGHWTGDSSIAFQVDDDGQIRDFHIEIEIPFSGTCTVEAQSVEVASDGSFRFQFGDSEVEDANIIEGRFDTDTSVTGTYSQALFCEDAGTGEGIMSFGEAGEWSARWTGP